MKKSCLLLSLAALAAVLPSCDYAQSNVTTLVTDDCGVSWQVIRAGESIPKGMGMCHYKVTIPDYPMQGESRFKATFKDRVLADIEVTYDYSIIEARSFVKEAKYLGKANSDSDDETNASKAFEMAENSVIDKRIKEVARDILVNEDIVDFSQSDFEDKLLKNVNGMLQPLGVQLSFLSFVPQPSEQTSQAIDVATAMKIYESRGLQEVGKAVIAARAGATKIAIDNKPQPLVQQAE
jgi:hypothetical protein